MLHSYLGGEEFILSHALPFHNYHTCVTYGEVPYRHFSVRELDVCDVPHCVVHVWHGLCCFVLIWFGYAKFSSVLSTVRESRVEEMANCEKQWTSPG